MICISSLFFAAFFFEYMYLMKKSVYDAVYSIMALAAQGSAEHIKASADAYLESLIKYIIYVTSALSAKLILIFAVDAFITSRLVRRQQRDLILQKNRFNAIAENIPGGVICCMNNEKFNIVYVSDGFVNLTGYTKEDIELKFDGEFFRMIFPSDRKELEEKMRREVNEYSAYQYRIIKSNGSTIWLLDKGNLIKGDGDGLFYRVLTDITDMKHTEQALIKSKAELNLVNERYRIVLEQSEYIVFDLDLISNNVTYSPNYELKFGSPASTKNFPKCFIDDDMVHYDDIKRFTVFFEKIKDGANNKDEEVRLRSRTGSYLWYNICVTTVLNDKGVPIRAIGRMADITRARSDAVKILTKSQIDEYTGLMKFDTAMEYIASVIESNRGNSHAMLLIDFDSFTSIDSIVDTSVISLMAARLRDLFRSSDIVGHISGCRFIVLMRNCNKVLLQRRADEIMAMLGSLCNDDGKEHFGNIGAALYPADATSCEDLYQKAQLALVHSVNKKKSGYSIYEEI